MRQIDYVAAVVNVDSDLAEIGAIDHLAEIGVRGVQQWGGSGDVDGFRSSANIESEIENDLRAHRNADALPLRFLESGMIDRDGIVAGIQERNLVVAVLVGNRAGGDVGLGIHDANGRSDNHGAAGIRDVAENRTTEFLGEDANAKQEHA